MPCGKTKRWKNCTCHVRSTSPTLCTFSAGIPSCHAWFRVPVAVNLIKRSAPTLIKSLTKNSTLRVLELGCLFSSLHAVHFSHSLFCIVCFLLCRILVTAVSHLSLFSLTCAVNLCQSPGLEALADCLKRNKTLQHVNLWSFVHNIFSDWHGENFYFHGGMSCMQFFWVCLCVCV